METMLEVIDASSGQSAATRDKFPNHVLTGRYAAGFANSLMSKDLKLYLGAVEAQGAPSRGERDRSGLGAVRSCRAGGRLHPHLQVRGGTLALMGTHRQGRASREGASRRVASRMIDVSVGTGGSTDASCG